MTEIKQCWAFHRDGARCEHPAGHAGDHMIEKTWDDSECAMPGEIKSQPAIPVLPQPLTEQPNKCVACGHAHRNGECKCGCHSFIG
jgi:hypothetical protein